MQPISRANRKMLCQLSKRTEPLNTKRGIRSRDAHAIIELIEAGLVEGQITYFSNGEIAALSDVSINAAGRAYLWEFEEALDDIIWARGTTIGILAIGLAALYVFFAR